jgi:hypothetical protein
MKIMKNTFSTLVLELCFPSIANCRKLKTKKIQKSTSPTVQGWGSSDSFLISFEAAGIRVKLQISLI